MVRQPPPPHLPHQNDPRRPHPREHPLDAVGDDVDGEVTALDKAQGRITLGPYFSETLLVDRACAPTHLRPLVAMLLDAGLVLLDVNPAFARLAGRAALARSLIQCLTCLITMSADANPVGGLDA